MIPSVGPGENRSNHPKGKMASWFPLKTHPNTSPELAPLFVFLLFWGPFLGVLDVGSSQWFPVWSPEASPASGNMGISVLFFLAHGQFGVFKSDLVFFLWNFPWPVASSQTHHKDQQINPCSRMLQNSMGIFCPEERSDWICPFGVPSSAHFWSRPRKVMDHLFMSRSPSKRVGLEGGRREGGTRPHTAGARNPFRTTFNTRAKPIVHW